MLHIHLLFPKHLRRTDFAFSSIFSFANSAVRLVSFIMYCLTTDRNSESWQKNMFYVHTQRTIPNHD